MTKTALRIRLFGDPVLRKKTQAVGQVTEAHRDILSEMARLMYASSGIGLAAPQVGVNESLIVVDVGKGLYKLINPKIARKNGTSVLEEGCLSIPGVCMNIKRPKNVLVEAKDPDGKMVKIEAEGLLAHTLQHEIDHLRGKLIIDYASFFERLRIRRKLRALNKRIEDEKLSESETKSPRLQL